MPQPRILFLTNRVPYPLSDGGALAMRQMMDGYRQQGWAVYALMMNASRQQVDEAVMAREFSFLAGCRTVPVRTDITVAGMLRNLLFSRLPEHATRFRHASFAQALEECLRLYQPDFIQIESVFLTEYVPLIRAHSSAVLILRMHNVEHEIWQRLAAETDHPLKRTYLRHLSARMKAYEERAWQAYEVLLPITRYDAVQALPWAGQAAVYTVPFGIGVPPVPAVPVPESWTGYHLGAMDWRPNVEAIEWFLWEAWPLVRQRAPGFRFCYAGRNMPARLLHPAQPGVSAQGFVADAAAFAADKQILIVPLHSGGGLRIKILEAMAQGKLVISTGVGIQGIDAQDGEHYLAADTAEAFADGIHWCLTHPEAALRIGQNARELVRRHYDAATIASGLAAYLLHRHPLV